MQSRSLTKSQATPPDGEKFMLARIVKIAIALVTLTLAGFWAWPRLAHTAEVSAPLRNRKTAAAGAPQNTGSFHLISALADKQWTLPAGDFANTRYSSLDQITSQNVKNLKVVATFSTGIARGHRGQPLVANGTMYVVTPYPNNLMAIDLKNLTGPLEWQYLPDPNPEAQARSRCCDTVNRGAAFGDGKIVYQALDDTAVAVDAKSGKEIWRTKTGDLNMGETSDGAPLIVKNKVYVGDSGGQFGVNGKLTCLDLGSGKILWTAYSQGPDAKVLINSEFKPYYPNDKGAELGEMSWDNERWQQGGGAVPGWLSYDPESNLIYYTTGNPDPWDPDLRPGDNKWTNTIFARNADSGYAQWAFQIDAHDNFGYNESTDNILVDTNWNGQPRKLLIHPAANGFLLVLDRQTGQLLSAKKSDTFTNWASGYDLQTGLPMTDAAKATHQNQVSSGICPSSSGATGLAPSAFSPQTGLVYIPAHNTCMDFEGLPANFIPGTPFIGASIKMYPGPGGFQGELLAWDIKNQKPTWEVKDALFPVDSGVLATAGNVVFYGTLEGWFRAVDARSGQILWQYKTPSGIIGSPITFAGPDGKQYIAIYSGVGGWMGSVAFDHISIDDPYAALGAAGSMNQLKGYTAPGDTVYIFGF